MRWGDRSIESCSGSDIVTLIHDIRCGEVCKYLESDRYIFGNSEWVFVQKKWVGEVMVHVSSQWCICEEIPKDLLAEVRNGGGSDEVRCS